MAIEVFLIYMSAWVQARATWEVVYPADRAGPWGMISPTDQAGPTHEWCFFQRAGPARDRSFSNGPGRACKTEMRSLTLQK